MKNFRLFILPLIGVVAGLLAYGLWSRPNAQPIDAEGFSAERVVRDIENIAQTHHSVAHPVERAKVREYLTARLKGLGADTVALFEYKNLVGPENKHAVYTFDAVNILAEFASPKSQEATKLMFIAHYDSRYSQPVPPRDTVWSYGAADDGYGVGVTLETLNLALKYRDKWQQGVKILFTDAEEVGMMGMKAMWEQNREQFDDVGFVINLEARGPNGPALLFETSAGNERIMELYDQRALSPFTYSLTTVVYSFMPNFTDFTIIKDTLPGVNFSTIADINHYHTDLDNLDNINPKSIQHYGAQVVPMVEQYLCDPKYSDKSYLCAENNNTSFTIPLLGLFRFSSKGYLWLNIAILALVLGLIALDSLRGRASIKQVGVRALGTLGAALAVAVLGFATTYICCLIADVPFKLFGMVRGMFFDNIAMVAMAAVMAIATTAIYMSGRAKRLQSVTSLRESAKGAMAATFATNNLYGVMIVQMVLSVALLAAIGENMMFFITLSVATLAMVLYRTTHLKVWLVLGIGIVLLHTLSFLYALSMALTIGAYGVVLMLAFLDVLAIIPLADLYLAKKR